jgi:hypothetical protein
MSADTRLEELGDADSSRLAQISLIIPSRASAVESAAYLLVAEALDDAEHRDASHVTVDIVQDGE